MSITRLSFAVQRMRAASVSILPACRRSRRHFYFTMMPLVRQGKASPFPTAPGPSKPFWREVSGDRKALLAMGNSLLAQGVLLFPRGRASYAFFLAEKEPKTLGGRPICAWGVAVPPKTPLVPQYLERCMSCRSQYRLAGALHAPPLERASRQPASTRTHASCVKTTGLWEGTVSFLAGLLSHGKNGFHT